MTGVSMTIVLSILMPLLGIFGNIFLRQHKNLRDTFTFLVSVLTFSAVFMVFLLTGGIQQEELSILTCLLYTSPSPRDRTRSRMPSSA